MTSLIWCLILLPRVRASDWRQSASVTSGTHSYDFVALAATERVPLFALQPWPTQQAPSRFDSDSFPVGIDTQSSRCISFNKAHFEDLHLHRVGECTGIGGHQVEIEGVGTLVFSIQDDAGLWHTHRVPNSLYIPKAKKVLICPQHWSQTAQDHSPLIHGTCEITTHVGTILFWNQRRYKRTLSLHPLTNTPIFYSRAGNRIIEAFTATFESLDASATAPREQAILLPPNSLLSHHPEHGDAWNGEELIHTSRGAGQPMHTIPPDAPCPYHPGAMHKWGECIHAHSIPSGKPSSEKPSPDLRPSAIDFDISTDAGSHDHASSVLNSIDDEGAGSLESPDKAAELMRYHYRFGHLSFKKLQLLAKIGEIPRALADIKPPACAGCLFGAMTRTP